MRIIIINKYLGVMQGWVLLPKNSCTGAGPEPLPDP